MGGEFVAAFWLLAAICAFVTHSLRGILFSSSSASSTSGDGQAQTPEFRRFQRLYLGAYLLAMAGDWLQGPYVYALYQQYGYGQADIALLFIAGFLSSAFFGTIFGSVADMWGRRRMALACCVAYSLSCLTKLSASFAVLMVGRLLAGISTSLLFSVFEAWLTCEHGKRGYPSEWLSQTFAWQTWGNGLVAIIAGVAANIVADAFGLVAPFMLALLCFAGCAAVAASAWGENYGQATSINTTPLTSLRDGMRLVLRDGRIAALGFTQSLFESAMYCFVFIWTPALQRNLSDEAQRALPFGWIFGAFMVAVMLGSTLFQVASRGRSVESVATACYGIASLCLFAPLLSDAPLWAFACFVVFEICCGVHFPLISTLRSRYVPEEARAALMSIYRVPLNLTVATVLVKVADMQLSTVLGICGCLLLLCSALASTLRPPEPTKATAV